MHPERVGILQRFGVHLGAGERLGGVSIVDALQMHSELARRVGRMRHGEPPIAGPESGPDGGPLGPVGRQHQEDVTADPVGSPDVSDLQQPIRSAHSANVPADQPTVDALCEPLGVESASDWKHYYRAERDRLGESALLDLVHQADPLAVRGGGAIVIPHTRLEITADQIATAVATILASGVERVLALGVLHGARRCDRDEVEAARAGDADARLRLRGIHDETGLASEEFSLDAFTELLTSAAQALGRDIDIVRRYPFLVGYDPADLPGITELEALVSDGSFLVATTDPIHHGHAYGTSPTECLDGNDADAVEIAMAAIESQLDALAGRRFDEFADLCEQHRSDFRDTGPVLAHLVGEEFTPKIHDLALVDYAEALDARSPTWVAGALITV